MLGNFMFFLSLFNDANVNFTVYMMSKPKLQLSPLSLDGIWDDGGSIPLHSLLTLELQGASWLNLNLCEDYYSVVTV